MSAIDDLRDLLKQKEITYSDLLNILILLEKGHTTISTKISVGLSVSGWPQKDMRTALAMGRLAHRIKVKIEKKLNE